MRLPKIQMYVVRNGKESLQFEANGIYARLSEIRPRLNGEQRKEIRRLIKKVVDKCNEQGWSRSLKKFPLDHDDKKKLKQILSYKQKKELYLLLKARTVAVDLK